MRAAKGNAATAGNSHGVYSVHGEANASILLDRLDGVQAQGKGWRARCPSCGGSSRKVSIAESGGKVLVHCFGGCRAEDVVGAVGLTWADLFPPRHWPDSPQERRQQRQAMREAAAVAAIDMLAVEATVIQLASIQLHRWEPLSVEDDNRLSLACYRIEKASQAMTKGEAWRHPCSYTEAGLVSMRRGAVAELRRQLDDAEQALRDAEAALAAKQKEAA